MVLFVHWDPIESLNLNDTVNLCSALNLSSQFPSHHLVCFSFPLLLKDKQCIHICPVHIISNLCCHFLLLISCSIASVSICLLPFLLQCLISAWCVFICPCQALLNITLNPIPLSTANAADRCLHDQQSLYKSK